MSPIRIAVVGMRGVLGDLVREIVSKQPDMEIVGESRRGALGRRIRSQPDLLILGLENSDLPLQGERLLTDYPRATVIGISADGSRGFIYKLRPYREPIGEVSPQVLLDTIRARRPPDGIR